MEYCLANLSAGIYTVREFQLKGNTSQERKSQGRRHCIRTNITISAPTQPEPPVYCNEAFRKSLEPPTPPQKSLIDLCTPDFDRVCGSASSVVEEGPDSLIEKEDKETVVVEEEGGGEPIFNPNFFLCGTMQSPPASQQQQQQQIPQAFANAGRAFSNFASSSLQNLTTRRYQLPDKSVASQVLMYRQLLHTKCRPGLKLSRDYQGTPAQRAVKHMPVSIVVNQNEILF